VRQRLAADAGSLAPLPATDLPDELAPLVQALNDLLGRLGASLDAQRAFVADAAHELRSPLTALKLQLHLLRRAADAEGRDSAVDALATGIERAARLVEQLLALARSEPGAPPVAPVAVDLGALADEVRALTAPYAASRGSRVEVVVDAGGETAAPAAANLADGPNAPDTPAPGGDDAARDGGQARATQAARTALADPDVPLTVPGDPAALHALLRNLVDNALRYGPDGTRVRVQVGRDGAAVRLQVDDDGPGIPAAERERVFQRFVRGAGGSAEAGSGLGLAIVRQVAERHRATLTLSDSPLGGLRVAVRFEASKSVESNDSPKMP
jgi:two-component system OmpR family sensor kinase/two-component system sensor histidine kinase QseC